MIRALLIAAAIAVPTAALALEQPADGDWFCGTGTEDLGALTIAGESYGFTDLADIRHEGELAAWLDGITYDVTTGILHDVHKVAALVYDAAEGTESLTLLTGDGAELVPSGMTCERSG